MVRIWLDAQLPRSLAKWLRETHGHDAFHVADLGLIIAPDKRIAAAAIVAGAIILTKDGDFRGIQADGLPKVIMLLVGNCSNAELREVLSSSLERALTELSAGIRVAIIDRKDRP